MNIFFSRVHLVIELLIKILGIVSIALSLAMVYLFVKVYRLQNSVILLGLPFGFLFLALSYILLGIHLMYPVVDSFSSSLMWLRVITQSLGFTLIAASYFLSGKTKGITKHNFFTVALWSIISVLCVLGALLIINPSGLASVYSFNELFTIANLALLSYIVFFIIRNLKLTTGAVPGLTIAAIAFVSIWIGQFSFLIWKLYGGRVFLVGSQVAPLIGLALFVVVYYLTSKRSYQVT
jgi:hypothetical protein